MRIKPEQLLKLLKKEQSQCFTIMGDEPLLSIEAADTIRHYLYHQGVTEREIISVDHRFEWGRISQWVTNVLCLALANCLISEFQLEKWEMMVIPHLSLFSTASHLTYGLW